MKYPKIFRANGDKGQVLVALLLSIPFFMLIVASYLNFSSSSFRVGRQDQLHTMAQMAADGGADYAIEQINQSPDWTGVSETTLHSDSSFKTTYTVTVTDNSSISKTLTVTGKAYWPATSATPGATVTVDVGMEQISSGNYSIATGEGGLIMSNSAKVTGGDVLVNGTITLSNTAQIGLSTNPVNVQVADAVCPVPPDATYPRVCTGADGQPEPISISNQAKIYGSVKANNQTSGAGMSSPGLVASSGVTTASLPAYDRDGQKAAVANTISGGFSCSSGSQTWPANTKIVGNVSISNKCKVTVQGNIWITGNFTMANSSQMVVDDSLGSTQPVIMVDGSGGATFSQGSTLTPNASGTGFEVITFYSKGACSPDCTDDSDADVYDSRGDTTISLNNSSSAANTLFYARWTEVQVGNTGQIGALIGQTVTLNNSGTITFTTSTGAGTTSWIANGYRRVF